ncbi:hypothetical protein M9H77_18216 [Catharanthus roseus]|uniref:Uncharacterized protein n=1 Tax=Catharanthus roseus TaxID=4058 RepID=A0ACC0B754_CATRO|nr:hypothetical protein M9H77_18216 [Catharanthus roseus]
MTEAEQMNDHRANERSPSSGSAASRCHETLTCTAISASKKSSSSISILKKEKPPLRFLLRRRGHLRFLLRKTQTTTLAISDWKKKNNNVDDFLPRTTTILHASKDPKNKG